MKEPEIRARVIVDEDGEEARANFERQMEELGNELGMDGRASTSYSHADATFVDTDDNYHCFNFAPIWGKDEVE